MAGEAHIISVGVRRNFRRRGIGELLMLNCFSKCVRSTYSAISLEVRSSNKAAQELYLKHGFLVEGTRKAYYSDNREDALNFSRPATANNQVLVPPVGTLYASVGGNCKGGRL